MKSIQALREQRNALAQQAKHIIAEKGDQIWSKEDKGKFDSIADQIDAIDSQIISMQRVIDDEAADSFRDVKAIDPKDKEAKFRNEAFAKFFREGERALSAEEHRAIRNTMSTTTGNQGGYSVQSDIASTYIDALKSYIGMRNVAEQITTTDGAPLSFPTSDGTAETGEWIAENTTATGSDPTFGTVALNVFKASSKIVAIPIELLQDSNIDIVGLIRKRLTDRIGRISNTGYTVGTGTGQPNGLVTAAATGKTGTTGQTLTVIYDDLVDLIDSVDIAYHNASMKFMFGQTVRKTIRKIKDTAGRPIWTPNYDAGIQSGFVDNLLGYDVQINNDMPVPAANAKSIAFGDLSKYMIRDAMALTLFRFDDSAYVKLGQIGFLAWARTGGNLLDTGAVKLYAHSAT